MAPLNLTLVLRKFIQDRAFSVCVKESSIHGLGVFATEKISKGAICTLYPADALGKAKGDKTIVQGTSDFRPHMSYAQTLWQKGDEALCAIGDPSRYSPAFCGHLINDPYLNVNRLKDEKDISNLAKEIIEYQIRVKHMCNCKLQSNEYYSYVVATREIDKGEELLAPYGFPYWTGIKKENEFASYMSKLDDKKRHFYTRMLVT